MITRTEKLAAYEHQEWRRQVFVEEVLPVDTTFTRDEEAVRRRVTTFVTTFADILKEGERKVKTVYGDDSLKATEFWTAEKGAIVFLENTDEERSATGGVPPYLPEVTLGPSGVFMYVHDAPLGYTPSGQYLGAYAGLVKSDHRVLTANVRPDPFAGVRVFVYGEPGETREVALWNGGERGQGVQVTIGDAPQVYNLGPSQVIALPTPLAGRVFFDPLDDFAPVVIGGEGVLERNALTASVLLPHRDRCLVYVLNVEGEIVPVNIRPSVAETRLYQAVIESPVTAYAELNVPSTILVKALWINGKSPESEFDTQLREGTNTITLETGPEDFNAPVTITIPGACFLIEVSRWTETPVLVPVPIALT